MNITTMISTRLRLEPLTHAHSQGMFELWSEPEVCRYAGSASDLNGNEVQLPAVSTADSDAIIEFFLHHQSLGNGCRWAVIRDDEEFLGIVGFNSLGVEAEIAYHLHPKFWGAGFMSEACRQVIDWLQSSQDSHRLLAFIELDNLPSRRLAERLGFTECQEDRDGAIRYERCLVGN